MSLPGRTIAGAPLAPTVAAVRTNSAYEVLSPLTLVSGSHDAVATVDDAISTNGATPYLERIAIRLRNRILFLETREIAYLEAYGNYVRFHVLSTNGGEPVVHTVRGTLSSFERRLDPRRFVRIHRSVIVSVNEVRELHSRRTGDFTLVTQAGDQLTLSRNFRNRVAELRRLLAS